MIISIHQPDYIPYLGYFYKIIKSDIFVFLDDVQFSKENMHNWNRIKTPQGECNLKIPVEYSTGDKINKVRTKDELKWKEKHLQTVERNYKRSLYFKDIFEEYKDIVMKKYKNLAELNMTINKFICDGFEIKTKFVLASELGIKTLKEERIIDICLAMGADTYISGHGAKAYQVSEHFQTKGVNLEYTDYKSFEYQQLWGKFIPNLSILDYVFNCGFDLGQIETSIREE